MTPPDLRFLAIKLLLVLVAVASLGLTACDKGAAWETRDITGLMPDLAFTLSEASDGSTVTPEGFRGKVLLVYFGYTNCPDVCPTTLGRLKSLVAGLGDRAGEVRVLFVTVDPALDTPKIMKDYSTYFGPAVVGLRGDQAELRALTKRYRVTYGYDKPDEDGYYAVSHSSAVYVFDGSGAARLLLRPTDSDTAIEHDLQRLVAEAG